MSTIYEGDMSMNDASINATSENVNIDNEPAQNNTLGPDDANDIASTKRSVWITILVFIVSTFIFIKRAYDNGLPPDLPETLIHEADEAIKLNI